ncbi:MAG: GTP-binding protein [Actinomycetota bacterium]
MRGFTARSGADLPERLEALAEAVELATDRLDEEAVAFGRHVVDKAAGRLRHGTTHTLVALLGATGSGKSSVANVVVGEPIATTGVRRPTTSSTLACFWGAEDVQPLLDWLAVSNRHRVTGTGQDLDGLVLLDVPDHDSVAEAHREEMERIAEHADLLLWVTDPEKYADKAMHDYLGRLSSHGAVTAMVLNKVDQLDDPDVEACRSDLVRLLGAAGLGEAPVIPLSATEATGVADLTDLLASTVAGQRATVDRLTADVATAATELLGAGGEPGGPSEVPDRVGRDLATALADASGVGIVADAVAAGHRRDAARKVGWPFTRWARRLRPHPLGRLHLDRGSSGRASLPAPSGVQVARTAGAVRDATAAVSADLEPPWPAVLAEVGTPDPATLNDRLDAAVTTAVRHDRGRPPRWWSAVNAVQLALAAAAVTGVGWLTLLAVAAYFRIPEPPTPDLRGIPLPTGLLIGGVLAGLLVAVIAGRLARAGGSRRARAVRRRATEAVELVADDLVIQPMQQELARRRDLRRLLRTAGGTDER